VGGREAAPTHGRGMSGYTTQWCGWNGVGGLAVGVGDVWLVPVASISVALI